MKYLILKVPGSQDATLIVEGAKMGDGSLQAEFHRKFDGSVPAHVFDVPDSISLELPPVYYNDDGSIDNERFLGSPNWEMAKVVFEAFQAAVGRSYEEQELSDEARKRAAKRMVAKLLSDLETDTNPVTGHGRRGKR